MKLSCGCEVDSVALESVYYRYVKEYNNEGRPYVAYMSVCDDCYQEYMTQGLILRTWEEQVEWMNQKGEPNEENEHNYRDGVWYSLVNGDCEQFHAYYDSNEDSFCIPTFGRGDDVIPVDFAEDRFTITIVKNS